MGTQINRSIQEEQSRKTECGRHDLAAVIPHIKPIKRVVQVAALEELTVTISGRLPELITGTGTAS